MRSCRQSVSCVWVKYRYGSKLNFEKELGLRLKGENGIMKKKFSALQKDIEDQREEIRTMFAHKKELYQVSAFHFISHCQ